jgi:hypothetical protein
MGRGRGSVAPIIEPQGRGSASAKADKRIIAPKAMP